MRMRLSLAATLFSLVISTGAFAVDKHPDPLPVKDSAAETEKEMKPYTELVEHSSGKIEMLPIPSGEYTMGSPDAEDGRKKDEGPQRKIKIEPFWMAKCEVTWDAYEVWMSDLDILRRSALGIEDNERDKLAKDLTISKPTPPYTDMTFGMGKRGYPAICMTQHAARTFCKWLTAKTGRYYRLPTEAEWEYACRAGTTTRYSFGDDASAIDEFAWHSGNAPDKYQKVGKLKPNPWGLHDMHGNVSEWVLDQYVADFYSTGDNDVLNNPLAIPTKLYPRVVRGGSWKDKPAALRSAARISSHADWKEQDPQIPQSIWYHTDALFVGFRIVRPLVDPTDQELKDKWDNTLPEQVDEEGEE